MARSKAETERLQAKLKAQVSYQSASSGTREAQLQSEIDKCMVSHFLDSFPTTTRINGLMAEHSEMLYVQAEHAEYCDYEVHALCVQFFEFPSSYF